MHVHEAIAARKSIRAFLDTPVDDSKIARLLTAAGRAPSGGNVQPWRIYVIGSEVMARVLAARNPDANTATATANDTVTIPSSHAGPSGNTNIATARATKSATPSPAERCSRAVSWSLQL